MNMTNRQPPNGYTRRTGRGVYQQHASDTAAGLQLREGDLIRFPRDVWIDRGVGAGAVRELVWPAGSESVVSCARPLFVLAPGSGEERYLPPHTRVDLVRRDRQES